MAITTSKYINNSDLKTSYIGLFNYKRDARGRNDTAIDMYGLMYVSSEVEIPGDKLTKFAWDGVIEGFEYSKTDSVNESLKLGLIESTRRVKQLITNDNNIGEHGVDINFTIFIANRDGVYIGVIGESDIFVYKKGRLVDIFEMLSSKNAKTAAIAIDVGDLIVTSTNGFLKDNMNKLISTRDRDELVFALEEIGKEVGDDKGLVVFSKEEEIGKAIEAPLFEEKIKNPKSRLSIKEPSTSDFIPISKIPKSIFKSPKGEKDLREILSKILKRFSIIKVGVSKVGSFSSPIFTKVGGKIVSLLKNAFSVTKISLSNSLGKKRWFKKVSAKFSQSTLGKKKNTEFKEFKIDGYKEKSTRLQRVKIIVLVFLGICMLVGGVKFTLDQKEAREKSRNANEIFTSVEGLLKDAQSKLGTDRESAELNIFKASGELAKIPQDLSVKDTNRLKELKGQVLGVEDSLFKKVRVSISNGLIEKYYDTFNFNQDSKPDDIGIYRDVNGNEYLVITDLGAKSVFTLSLYDKKVSNIPDENNVLDRPSKVYVRPKGIFVLDLTNGILKADVTDGGFKSLKKLSGLSIQSIGAKDIAEFAVLTDNENSYVLDREKKTLLKSINYDGGYSLSSPYFTKDEYVKANDVLSDLSVYILAQAENGIYRYVSTGKGMVESPITLTGLDTPLKNPKCGHTVDNLNNGLFIFDSEDKRVLKFEKPIESGEKRHPNEFLLLNQYVFEGGDSGVWKNVKDIVVDYREEYLYMLDGTTIWKIEL